MSLITKIATVRGVTVPTPEGCSVPDPAERLAALARQNGWDVVEQKWYRDPYPDGRWCFFLGVGRLLRLGESVKSSGVGWRYHLVWDAVSDRHRVKMAVRVSRCYTPTTGKWTNGPSVKVICDTILRNPLR